MGAMAGRRLSPLESKRIWSGRGDLNARPPAPKQGGIGFGDVWASLRKGCDVAFSMVYSDNRLGGRWARLAGSLTNALRGPGGKRDAKA